MADRFRDDAGMTVEVTPNGFVVRDQAGRLVDQAFGVETPLPRTPEQLVGLGVDLASLVPVQP